jgi:hypothetical protein
MPWYAAPMLQGREVFEAYVGLLRKVVLARGGDVNRIDQEYAWPADLGDEIPKAAASLSPLLTGGASQPPWAQGQAASGVVSVPHGLTPPPRR